MGMMLTMLTMIWTFIGAIYSLVPLIQTLFGKPSPSWKKILLPAVGLWLVTLIVIYL